MSLEKIHAKGDRVVVTPIDVAEKVQRESSRLYIPDSVASNEARSREFRLGKVVSVGPGKQLPDGGYLTPGVNVGEIVTWRKFDGVECRALGHDVVILKTDEILGVVES